MSVNTGFTLAIALKALVACAAITAGALLAYHDKGDWGWFLLVACFVAPGQIDTTSEAQEKEPNHG